MHPFILSESKPGRTLAGLLVLIKGGLPMPAIECAVQQIQAP